MRRAALLLGVLCLSCGNDAVDTVPPALELGTGEWQFEPMIAAQRVQLVGGTQGGYHVWLSVRAQGFVGERLRMQLDLRSDGPAPLAHSDLEIGFDPVDDEASPASDRLEHVGWPAQLLDPWCAVEKTLTIDVTVSDRHGHSASAALAIIPTAPVRGFAQSCSLP
jgi:hypothetical protein